MKHFFIQAWFLLLVLFATKCNCAQEKGGLSSKKTPSNTKDPEQNEEAKTTLEILLSQLKEKPVQEAFVADLKKGASQLNKEDFDALLLAATKATATPEVLQKIVQAILNTPGASQLTPELVKDILDDPATSLPIKKLLQQFLLQTLLSYTNDTAAFSNLLNKIKDELTPANYATLLEKARNNKDLVAALLVAGKAQITTEAIQAEHSKTTNTNTQALLQQHLVNNGQLVKQLNDQVGDPVAFSNLLNQVKDELTPANYATLLEKARNNKDLVGALLAAGKDKITTEAIQAEHSKTTDTNTQALLQQHLVNNELLVNQLNDQIDDPIAFSNLLNQVKDELTPANYATLLEKACDKKSLLVAAILLTAGKDKLKPEVIQAEVSKTTDTNTKKLLQEHLVNQLSDQVGDAAAFKKLLNKIKDELTPANYATLLEKARNKKDLIGALLAAGKGQITPELIQSELSKTIDRECLVDYLSDQVNNPVVFTDLLYPVKYKLTPANYATLLEKARNNKDLVGALLAAGKDQLTPEVIQSEISKTTDSDTKKLFQEHLVNQLIGQVGYLYAAAFKELLNKIKDELTPANYATLLEKVRDNKDLVGALLAAGKDQITSEVILSELSKTTDSDTRILFREGLVHQLSDQVNNTVNFTNLLNQVKDKLTRENYVTLLEKARNKKDVIEAILAAGKGELTTGDIEKEKDQTTEPSTKKLLEQALAMANLSNVGGYFFVTDLEQAKNLLTPTNYATLLKTATDTNNIVAVAALLTTGKGTLEEQTIKDMLSNAKDKEVKKLLAVAVNPASMPEDKKVEELFDALNARSSGEIIAKFWITVGGVSVDAKNKAMVECTPLQVAVNHGDMPLITWLLDKGADINASDKLLGSTPLLGAIATENVGVIEQLLLKGADPRIPDKDGTTPLHRVAKLSSISSVGIAYKTAKLLLEKGTEKPDINAKNSSGTTPLHEAVWWGRDLALVELFLQEGANVNEKDKLGRTPLALLQAASPIPPYYVEILKLLKSKGGTT